MAFRPSRRAVMRAAPLLALAPFAARPAAAAPKSRLIDRRWTQFGAGPEPDHSAFDALLAARRSLGADGIARFDYAAVTAAERRALADYIGRLEAADPLEMGQDAAFAYWCNLYNAATLALVLEAYPVRSIRSVRGGLFNTGPWTEKILTVNEARLSLDDVEHGILRPIWRDARVHYAVNCAALGCPNLPARAWRAEGLSAALDAAARAYVNHPRGARITRGRLIVSSIYDWFQEDFGGDDAGVIAHLSASAAPPLKAALAEITRISDDDYDWALNGG